MVATWEELEAPLALFVRKQKTLVKFGVVGSGLAKTRPMQIGVSLATEHLVQPPHPGILSYGSGLEEFVPSTMMHFVSFSFPRFLVGSHPHRPLVQHFLNH